MKLIQEIMDTDPTFDADKFLEGNEQSDEYMKKSYTYYPPYDSDCAIKDAVTPKVEILRLYLIHLLLCINIWNAISFASMESITSIIILQQQFW